MLYINIKLNFLNRIELNFSKIERIRKMSIQLASVTTGIVCPAKGLKNSRRGASEDRDCRENNLPDARSMIIAW